MSDTKTTAVYGTLERSLDSRLRITLSKEFEDPFHNDPPVLCYWSDYSLALLPQSIFDEFLQQLMATKKDIKTQSFKNFFLANANKLTIDSNHRVTLRRQDVEYIRKAIAKSDEAQPTEFDWRQEVLLSGQYNYILIQAVENAKQTLSEELMPEYGDYLEESCISLQQSLLDRIQGTVKLNDEKE